MPWGKQELIDMVAAEESKSSVLPPGLLRAIADTETRGAWATGQTSPKGAHGLFQFMPSTAKAYKVDSRDPSSSAAGARSMLEDLWKQFDGDINKVIAAYNWGSGRVSKHGLEKAPAETREYLKLVNAALPKFAGAQSFPVAPTPSASPVVAAAVVKQDAPSGPLGVIQQIVDFFTPGTPAQAAPIKDGATLGKIGPAQGQMDAQSAQSMDEYIQMLRSSGKRPASQPPAQRQPEQRKSRSPSRSNRYSELENALGNTVAFDDILSAFPRADAANWEYNSPANANFSKALNAYLAMYGGELS